MSPVKFSYLSLGWGVQSTAIACMMAEGELERADVLIHSDTGHERQGTYEIAALLTPWLAERGMRVVTVSADNADPLRADWGGGGVMIPAFAKDKATGKFGQLRRQCTHDWKIMPIRRYVREEFRRHGLSLTPGSVKAIMGISIDEWQRMRDPDVKYMAHSYPLVDRRMSRRDCEDWLIFHGLPVPPKSSCTFCPYHGIAEWKRMKRAGGHDWNEAVQVDAELRDVRTLHWLYVHPYREPLEEAVKIPEDDGQMAMDMPCDSGVCFT